MELDQSLKLDDLRCFYLYRKNLFRLAVVEFHTCFNIATFYLRFAESKWTQAKYTEQELKRNTNKAGKNNGKNNETYKICVATTMTKTATTITKTH